MKFEQRLADLGITLPEPASPVATYVRYVQTGNLLYISGTGPDKSHPTGKVGADLSVEQGVAAARSVGIGLIATMKQALGDLDRVVRVVKLSLIHI